MNSAKYAGKIQSKAKSHIVRREQILRCISDVFEYKTMLYIGAKVKKTFPVGMQMIPDFKEAGYEIDVLEAWRLNVRDLIKMNKKEKIYRTILLGDVRNSRHILADRYYDVIIWWHGPEHVNSEEIMPTIKKLESHARKMIIIACPFGRHKQGIAFGNPYEKHLSTIYPEDFKKHKDWHVDVIGERDVKMSNLLAWKRTDNVL